MVISMHRSELGSRPTGMDIPALAVEVVQSEKDLFYYAFCNGHGEPVLSERSKRQQARA